ncbi:MAG: ATP synthase F1 subunit delta [Clostridiaceae bacterium]|nr:ATP synthase F1 subunit delta [Clostridiaceae bacterium]
MAKLASNVYGEALFEAAVEEGLVDSLMEEVNTVLAIFQSNEEYIRLLSHPKIPAEEKVSLLESAFRGKVSDQLTGFLITVAEKGRFVEIEDILGYFDKKVSEYKKIGTAYVISAGELSAQEKEAIEKRLLETTAYRSFRMNYSVDAALIGGVVIRIGDRVVDSSIRTKLNNMAKDLSKIQLA